MVKRVIAIPLWFMSVWWAYSMVAFVLGVSPDGGVILGALVAAFVYIDPTGVIWASRTREPSSANPADRLGAAASTR